MWPSSPRHEEFEKASSEESCRGSGARAAPLAGRADVSLDHGGVDAGAAVTAFLPKAGVRFDWVLYHWIAGLVLTVSILFHIVHASFYMDFWSIWPDRTDMRDAMRRVLRFFGKPAPPPSGLPSIRWRTSCITV